MRDEQLVAQAARGDLSAFDLLVQRYRRVVCTVALRLLGDGDLAEDASQEALVKAFRRLGRLRDPTRFRPWVLAITVNECRRLGRQATRQRSATHSGDVPGEQTAEETALAREDVRCLLEAMRRLPRRQRTAIVLASTEGLSMEDIAETMGCSPGTIKAHLHRARANLARVVEERANADVAEAEVG